MIKNRIGKALQKKLAKANKNKIVEINEEDDDKESSYKSSDCDSNQNSNKEKNDEDKVDEDKVDDLPEPVKKENDEMS